MPPAEPGFQSTAGFLAANSQVLGADADLHDARLVDPGHADILEDAIVDLALLGDGGLAIRRLRRQAESEDQRADEKSNSVHLRSISSIL